jgi:hypothetical protein
VSTSRSKRTWCIVFAALAVILAVATIRSIRLYQQQNERLICLANLKGFATCVKIYVDDNDADIDVLAHRLAALGYFGPQMQASHCPTGRARYRFAIADPQTVRHLNSTDIFAFEPLSNHGGVGASVIYADGHAEFLSPDEFRRECAAQGIPLTE